MDIAAPADYADPEDIREFDARQEPDIHRYRPAANGVLRQLLRLATILKLLLRRPDVVLATGDRACYLVCFLTRFIRRPWVSVQHGRLAGSREMAIKRWMLGHAHAVVHVSDYTRQKIIATFGNARKDLVIHNGADAERFAGLSRDELPATLGLPSGRLLLTVGNVTRRKGQETVIRGLPSILERVPDAHYVMAGLPTEKAELEALADQLGVGSHIHFLGKVSDRELELLLLESEVFVMTSRHAQDQWEGFGIAVVEAAMTGLPAVVTGPSGLAEAVVEGTTGLIVPEDHPAATAEALLTLLTDDDLRRSMGRQAQKRALEELTWQRCAERFDKVLREQVENPG